MALTKILIANRGEIAIRVMGTARRLGYRTVAVYSSADRGAPHVAAADEAVLLGPAPASESYLAGDKIIAAARQAGAQAVHPGYGFLAENAAFAQACAAAGLIFIGPPVAAIELMGNKRAAKAKLLEAGVPCVPGYQGAAQDDATLRAEAERIGYPVMVKAAAGGGGRGMRLVGAAGDLDEALSGARKEAESSFGSGELLLEKAIVEPRHVEIQIFGDTQGNLVHLGERDCSVQRRHQKVIEESPSPAVDEELRQRMGQAAVEAARACGYVGAGTVEFLLDRDGAFHFLEMNTRLQVEHPVTELVTGVDLVEWQLRVAAGEPLPLSQGDIRLTGHAVEARLYAEDPAQGFLHQTGEVLQWRVPAGADVRVDHAVEVGGVISPHYDPMIAKVIAHGASRDDACRKLAAALRDTTLFGVVTNKSFLANICVHEQFAAGEATTAFLTDHFADDPTCVQTPPDPEGFACAALVACLDGARDVVEDDTFIGWRSGGPVWVTVKLDCAGAEAVVDVTATGCGDLGRRYAVTWVSGDEPPASDGDEPRSEPPRVELELVSHGPEEVEVLIAGVQRRNRFAVAGSTIWLDDGLRVRSYQNATHLPVELGGGAASGRLSAPLDGEVIGVRVAVGDAVEAGQLVLVVEAMKMEHRIHAEVAGTVAALHVAEGDQVKTRQLLAEIEPAAETTDGGEG
ncbi:MAG: acetyl-CoA carboxylase biotin carboxylase subunit [Deltaproteobacteria bacterium]|nr:acetyl-CoA carboxylase biotin carboxylase subunit [Deltaproteobacteria bacterium]